MVKKYERSVTLLPAGEMTNVVAQQALSSSQSLEKRLDRLSTYFYSALEKQAETEGQLYGVKNAPTLKQITEAIENKQDVNALFAQEGSVYGDAARVVQAELFRQDATAVITDKVKTYAELLDQDDPSFSFDQVETIANDLQSEIDGVTDVLGNISADSAVKFNASSATLAHDLYRAANKKALETQKEIRKKQVDGLDENYLSVLSLSIIENNGDVVSVRAKTEPIKQTLISSYKSVLSDGAATSRLLDLPKKIRDTWMASGIKMLQQDEALMANFQSTYNALVLGQYDMTLKDGSQPYKKFAFLSMPDFTQAERANFLIEATKLQDQRYNVLTKESKLKDDAAAEEVAQIQLDIIDKGKGELTPETEMHIAKQYQRLEDIAKNHPSAIKPEAINAFKKSTIEDLNEFSPEADEIKQRISLGEFKTWPEAQKRILIEYPNYRLNDVNVLFYKYYKDSEERELDTQVMMIVDQVKPIAIASTSERAVEGNIIKRQIRQTILSNMQRNKDLGKNQYPTSPSEVANIILQKSVERTDLVKQANTLEQEINQILTAKRIFISFSNYANNPDTTDKALKDKLSDEEYNQFITSYNKWSVIQEKIRTSRMR